ncbi:MAG: fatty acid cis/trans isomerase [Sulfurimonas sp.]|nr:fatty acid cis/trans isomerase [Sulfurimonas sp.]
MKALLGTIFHSLLFLGCSNITPPSSVKVKNTKKSISYIHDVKPILDKRCVSCHSCYNSPCQAKLSSFEGIDRGASKNAVYDSTRLSAMDPSRLFIDEQTTQQWQDKDFFSLTKTYDSNASSNDSLMILMLHEKKNKRESRNQVNKHSKKS